MVGSLKRTLRAASATFHHAAVSLPAGLSRAGLPIGLQLVGRAFDEASLFRVGDAFEQATSWHDTRPPAAPG